MSTVSTRNITELTDLRRLATGQWHLVNGSVEASKAMDLQVFAEAVAALGKYPRNATFSALHWLVSFMPDKQYQRAFQHEQLDGRAYDLSRGAVRIGGTVAMATVVNFPCVVRGQDPLQYLRVNKR